MKNEREMRIGKHWSNWDEYTDNTIEFVNDSMDYLIERIYWKSSGELRAVRERKNGELYSWKVYDVDGVLDSTRQYDGY